METKNTVIKKDRVLDVGVKLRWSLVGFPLHANDARRVCVEGVEWVVVGDYVGWWDRLHSLQQPWFNCCILLMHRPILRHTHTRTHLCWQTAHYPLVHALHANAIPFCHVQSSGKGVCVEGIKWCGSGGLCWMMGLGAPLTKTLVQWLHSLNA